MKRPLLIILFCWPALYLCAQEHAVRDTCCLAPKDLVGVWQRDSKEIGNGIGQNFQFHTDGSFFLDMHAAEGEDARAVISIQGKYRLVKNKLFITILGYTIIQGARIYMPDQELNTTIFGLEGGAPKLIMEPHPVEDKDPLFIRFTTDGGVLIGSEAYYKVSPKDYKMAGIYFTP